MVQEQRDQVLLGPIRKRSLREQAKAAIRSSIITGQLEPGKLYPMTYFASRLGVSATPVREAILDLATEGLIELVPHRGFRVPHRSAADIAEIYELRMILEVGAVERLAGKLTEEDIARCEALLDASAEALENGDVTGFLAASRDFHETLLAALGNKRLLEIVMRLRDQTPLTGLVDLAQRGALKPSLEEHRRILEALVRGDTRAAAKAMRQHLQHIQGVWAGLSENTSPENLEEPVDD